MQLSQRSKLLLKLFATLFIFCTLMRISFVLGFSTEAGDYSFSDLIFALYLGGKFDVRVVLTLLLPITALFWVPFLDPTRSSLARKLWGGVYALTFFLAISIYSLDIAYYRYLHGRLNATVLDFLDNFWISAEMVWQTYPLVWLTLFCCSIGVFAYWMLQRFVFIKVSPLKVPFKKKWISGLIIFLAYVGGLHGKLSQYPLRWSEVYFSDSPFIAATALNPVHYFFDTLKNRSKSFDIAKARSAYPIMSKYLNVASPTTDPKADLNFHRPIRSSLGKFNIDPKNPPNIVVIVLESLGAYKSGVLGHPLKPTPYLDEAAAQGLVFSEYYVPSEATARSIYCLITGIPDVNAHNGSSSRNPLIIDQNSVANAFTNYSKHYFIGGSANWGNIRGVITNNIYGVNLVEEDAYSSPRTDVWGISDLHLFREAFQKLKKQKDKKPFLAFIQSAGFHRPYTIPEDKGDFKPLKLNEEELRKYGFISNEEYNSLRFQDYSFGEFYKLTKNDPTFKNTIFLITGDHGLPDYNAAHVFPGSRQYNLERWHVPLVFYAPGLIPAGVESQIATEPDLLPTLAGLTGQKFVNTTLGENLFARTSEQTKYAFTFVYYQTPPQIGLLDKEFYVFGIPGKITTMVRYRSEQPTKDVKLEFPEKWAEMSEMVEAYYQTSRYMLYHNTKKASTNPTEAP